MDNDRLVVLRQAQSGQKRGRNAPAADKNDSVFASSFHARDFISGLSFDSVHSRAFIRGLSFEGFHSRSVQARSAASISVATSFSVCAVDMIQCSPFEGVM